VTQSPKLGMMVRLTGGEPWSAFEQQMDVVRRGQFDCVQLSLHRGPELGRDVLLRAADALYQREVELAAIGLYLNLLRPDDRTFFAGNDLETFDTVVQVMRETEGRPVVMWGGTHAPGLGDPHPDNHTEPAYQQVVDQARRLAEPLAEVGAMLVVEPFYPHVLGSAFQLTRFCQDVGPAAGVVLDPINLITPETFPDHRSHLSAVVTALADNTALVHLKDLDFNAETGSVFYPGPGRGVLDYAWYARTLTSAAVGVPAILEHMEGEDFIDARAQIERSLG